MPIVTIQTPQGASVQIDAPEGATDEQIFRFAKSQGLFDQAAQVAAPKVQDEQVQDQPSIGQQALGVAENVGSLVSGAIAEPIAGLAGIAQSLNPFADEGAGARAVESVRGALTIKPSTEAGQAQQQIIGKTLAPVGEALSSTEKFLGENVLELTGSPALASVAHSLPTAVLELIGFKGAKRITGAPKEPTKRAIKKSIVESAPEIDQIKSAASAVYKEIDDSGVRIKPQAINNLVGTIEAKTRKSGLDPRVTKQAAGALEALREMRGADQPITELMVQKNIAQKVAGSADPGEKMLGNIMIDEIDSFLDSLSSKDLTKGDASTGKKVKVAGKLWGRAKRAELITQAITRGEDVAAGAEAGIRNEFNRILRNKKLSKFIPKDEQALMRDVVKGDFKQNITRLIGKVGLSVDRSPNVFGSIVAGGGLGTVLGGTAGAIVVPVIGTISKQIAKKLTTNKAKFTEAMTRAGTDGKRIAKAYLSSVPKAKRSIDDLADLLSDPKINIDDLEFIASETVKDALELAKGKRAINLAVGATTGTIGDKNNQGDN